MTKKLLIASRVSGERQLTERIRELTLAPIHRDSFPPFEPGDHIQLQHLSGVRRDYSICNTSIDPRTYTVAIQRDDNGRGGSILFHNDVRVGDEIFASYPQRGMTLDPAVSTQVFIAGGIGVTAIVGLLGGLQGAGSYSIVHYAVRGIRAAAYLDRLRDLASEVHVYDSGAGCRADVTSIANSIRDGQVLYYCGPQRMMDEIAEATGNWPAGRARSESYTPAPPPGQRQGDPFDARIGPDGQLVHVPETTSLLRALLAEGIDVNYSCEGGICASCTVELIDGVVEHHDTCLSPEQRIHALTTCVSRGTGEIIIQV